MKKNTRRRMLQLLGAASIGVTGKYSCRDSLRVLAQEAKAQPPSPKQPSAALFEPVPASKSGITGDTSTDAPPIITCRKPPERAAHFLITTTMGGWTFTSSIADAAISTNPTRH